MKSQKKLKKVLPALIPCVLLFATSCQLEVPIKEVISAKKSIDKAYTVKAKTYSPDKLKEAESLLLKSNEYIKNEESKDAKNSALASIKASTEAFDESLPPYSDDCLKKAEEKYLNADKVYSEKFSPSEFNKSGDILKKSREAQLNKKYLQSIKLSNEAYDLATIAETQSRQNGPMLETELIKLKDKITEIKKIKVQSKAEELIKSAEQEILEGTTSLTTEDYKIAYAKIQSAKEKVDNAYIMVKTEVITEEVAKLRNEIKNALNSNHAENIEDDLNEATLSLDKAESLTEQNNFDQAQIKIEEARKIIDASNVKAKKNSLLAKIENTEKKLHAAIKEDKNNKYEESLDSSKKLILESRDFLNNKNYDNSNTKIEEADILIDSILNSLDEDRKSIIVSTEKKEDSLEDEEIQSPEEKTYTVQWRKKNTDCLWRIALKVYKDAKLWPAIYIANKDQIKDPDLIFPGQKFIIPPKPKKIPDYRKAIKENAIREENK